AGLSLHKPIKPFSVLHARVLSSDRDFFEKMLGLSPAERENAQLCLILSQTDAPLNAKVELHGLHVVSQAQLEKDVEAYGDSDLTSEMSYVFSN
ncbi:hypothetical protein KAZ57_00280, partial [Patescibacteria group bacterium]|nr:hypothetical protein [Patescibacteria group bacterium]